LIVVRTLFIKQLKKEKIESTGVFFEHFSL